MPKIIGKDNHDRDGISDIVRAENLTQKQAELLCEELNRGLYDGPGTYYVIKPDDYVPYVFNGW